jgi:UDP-glucose 4-epimerase
MDLTNKIVLVTGGAGFIGSHLIDKLLEKRVEKIIIYDNFSTGRERNLEHLKDNKKLRIVRGDILDYETLRQAVGNAEVIFHEAAQLEIFKAVEDPLEDLKVNVVGTLNVLRAALDSKAAKVVFASSACCYGQARYTPQDENHPLRAQWPYGVSKLAAEKYCIQFYELYGLKTVALRYSIVYGPREWYRRVMTVFTKMVLEGKAPVIFGNGRQTRDFVHVNDVSRATILAAEKETADGEEINIGSGIGTTINELADMITRLAGKEGQIKPKHADPDSYQMGRKPGELVNLCLDITRARNLLRWEPCIGLEEGLKQYIEWLSENKKVYWG